MPKVYVIEDGSMNAFATGRDPQHASVAITRGLLEKLDKLRARRRHGARAVARRQPRHAAHDDARRARRRRWRCSADLVFRMTLVRRRRPRQLQRQEQRRRLIILVSPSSLAILAPIVARDHHAGGLPAARVPRRRLRRPADALPGRPGAARWRRSAATPTRSTRPPRRRAPLLRQPATDHAQRPEQPLLHPPADRRAHPPAAGDVTTPFTPSPLTEREAQSHQRRCQNGALGHQ